MLKELLSRDECAKCQICCCFDDEDIWEAPVISKENQQKILEKFNSAQKFISNNNQTVMAMDKAKDEELYYCSMLDHKKGCVMKDEKPFDCKIWPFRVMDFEGKLVITLSPVCPVVKTRPLDKITDTLNKISPIIFEQAEKHPEIVKPYIDGYPILKVK